MKTKFQLLAIAITILFFYSSNANAAIKFSIIDSTCCKPDSLKVVSTNFPTFCVSWQISTDSACQAPYGFEVEWRQFPSALPWNNQTVIYSGGTTINFCAQVLGCGNYQWRVRTICDTAGVFTYSDWVYGNKFAMRNCLEELQIPSDSKDKRSQKNQSFNISKQAIMSRQN